MPIFDQGARQMVTTSHSSVFLGEKDAHVGARRGGGAEWGHDASHETRPRRRGLVGDLWRRRATLWR